MSPREVDTPQTSFLRMPLAIPNGDRGPLYVSFFCLLAYAWLALGLKAALGVRPLRAGQCERGWFFKGQDTMPTNVCFLDEATQNQILSEMGATPFADTYSAVKHFSFLAKSGKRFSVNDVTMVFAALGLDTEPIPAALAELVEQRVLEAYSKDGATAYYMERGARIEYGESIGRPTRASGWKFLGTLR